MLLRQQMCTARFCTMCIARLVDGIQHLAPSASAAAPSNAAFLTESKCWRHRKHEMRQMNAAGSLIGDKSPSTFSTQFSRDTGLARDGGAGVSEVHSIQSHEGPQRMSAEVFYVFVTISVAGQKPARRKSVNPEFRGVRRINFDISFHISRTSHGAFFSHSRFTEHCHREFALLSLRIVGGLV
jgi:hypothetical protein